MHGGDVLLVVLILVFGCAAFIFGVLYMVFRAVAWVARGALGLFRPASLKVVGEPVRPGSLVRVCPHERCRRVEYRREACYCSQCGTPLT